MKTLIAIFSVLKVILILLLIAILVISITYYLVRTRDEALVDKNDSEKDVEKYVQSRYKIMRQMIDAFGDNNPNTDKLEKLLALSDRISTHEDEVNWDAKYIQFMKRFIDFAGENCRPEMIGSFRMANDSLESNESNLDAARARLFEASNRVDSFDKGPKKQLTSIGDAIIGMIKHFDDKKEQIVAASSDSARHEEIKQKSVREADNIISSKAKADNIRKSQTGFSSNPFAVKKNNDDN